MALTKINSTNRFFIHKEKEGQFIFNGTSLKLYIPKRYAVYDLLSIGETLETLGVFKMEIDGKYWTYFHCLATLSMTYTDVTSGKQDGLECHIVTLTKGDIFIRNTTFVKSANNIRALYIESITRGRMNPAASYTHDLPMFIDDAGKMCDAYIPVDHAIMEMIIAHLSRNPKDLSQPLRLTSYRKDSPDYVFTGLSNITRSPSTTTSRIVGAYFHEGTAAALVTQSEEESIVENLLRGTYTPEQDPNAY